MKPTFPRWAVRELGPHADKVVPITVPPNMRGVGWDTAQAKHHLLVRVTKPFTVYKKCYSTAIRDYKRVIELEILPDACIWLHNPKYESMWCGHKMRVNWALSLGRGVSLHDPSYRYSVDKLLRPEQHWSRFFGTYNSCAAGIHFFIDRKYAEAY